MTMFVAYGERNATLKLYEALKRKSVGCSVVNTPREVAVGCGLSVKFYARDYKTVLVTVAGQSKKSFKGIFKEFRGEFTRIY